MAGPRSPEMGEELFSARRSRPHEDFGEEVRAVVQLQPGEAGSSALAEELIAWCRQQLSPIKCPRVVDFRDALPREPNGKLLKRLLRDEYRAAHAAQSVAPVPIPTG